MFDALSLPLLLTIFGASAGAVWIAGVHLSNSTDVLSTRWHMGEALGGLILLAIVTNLPELAITASGALQHNIGIAIGNILGGIAIQTVVLVLLDVIGLGRKDPLTYRAASLSLVLEGLLVVAVLATSIIGTQLPKSLVFARVAPSGVLIAILWIAGIWLIGKSRHDLPWQDRGQAPGGQDKPRGHPEKQKEQAASDKKVSTGRTLLVFCISAIVTLVCGILLEMSGDAIAKDIGMSGMLFGATVLAAATALPEVSTGLASVKLGDYQLAVSDIFGGNAFLPVLFLMASLLSGEAILPHAQATDIYLTGLGMLLTVFYVTGLIFRPRRQIARMGIDSLLVLILYLLGVLGLVAISRS
jgi:cation:H+ antiporter